MTYSHSTLRPLGWAAFLCIIALAGCSPPKSSFTVNKATVIKVYSVTDTSGHRFVSYVVDRGGVEIVVADTLAKTTYKVGDTIEYLDQKIEISGTKTLSFSIAD
jgi:predicted secreted Zn-dependent protease